MAQWLLCGAGPVVMIRHVSHVWRRSEWRIKYLEKTPSCRFNCLQRWGLEKFPYFQVICAAPQTSLTCLVVALARLIVWLILWRVSGVLCMGTLGAVTTFHALEKFKVECFFTFIWFYLHLRWVSMQYLEPLIQLSVTIHCHPRPIITQSL